jgi:hypothetical protein
MNALRWLAAFALFALASVIAPLFTPAPVVASFLQSRLGTNVILSNAHGSLLHGGAILSVPAAGLQTPLSWKLTFPPGLNVTIGNGDAQLRPVGLSAISVLINNPITLALSHPQASGVVTVEKNTQAILSRRHSKVSGTAKARDLSISLPTTRARFDAATLTFAEDGTFSLSGSGDANASAKGTIAWNPTPRGGVDLTLAPTGRNSAFDAAVRANFTARDNKTYTYAHRF